MLCTFETCNEMATFHLTDVEDRKSIRERHLCEDHARIALTSCGVPPVGPSRTPRVLEGAKHFDIDMVIISEINENQVVYLHEVGGDRRIPILIGIFEATALDRYLKGTRTPRPLTHDAAASILTTLGGELDYVLVDRFVDCSWCAQLHIRQDDRQLIVDVRPSDAFALAVVLERPIFFANAVIDKVLPPTT